MKHIIFTLFALITFSVSNSYSCTNFLVSPGASVDGSSMISYAADSHLMYGELYFWPATTYNSGDLKKIYEWDTGKFLGNIEQTLFTYKVIGNMNEYQLAIGETTYGGRSELSMARDGQIMDYGSLIYTTLQRAKSAREAIVMFNELTTKYGYYSSGESFSIADKNEVWILEMIGKGGKYSISKSSLKFLKKSLPTTLYSSVKTAASKSYLTSSALLKVITDSNKDISESDLISIKDAITSVWDNGAVWVARRIPDGYISGHANQARITTFPLADGVSSITSDQLSLINNASVETVYSADVITFAKDKGWYKGADKDFSFSDTYAPVDFGGARFCEARVWSGFNKVTKGMDKYLQYAMGYDLLNRMPLWVKPDKKLTVQDMMGLMRDYYQNSPMDMTKDMGAGAYGNIVRWRPLTWKVDGETYFNERAVSTQQTGFSFVSQSRKWLPDAVGGVYWFGVDETYTSVYTPIFVGTNKVPHEFAVGNGNLMDFSDDAAFWVFNQVSNYAYTRFSEMIPYIQAKQTELENNYVAAVALIDDAVQHTTVDYSDFITDFSCNAAATTVNEWSDLYRFLFTRFMDGNIKTKREVPEGYLYIAPEMSQPGYGNDWYKKIVEETGDKFKMPGGSH